MQIQDLLRASGAPAKTIRYYESIRLLPPPQRAANNYRRYHPADVERLRFIASARSLGVGLGDLAEILAARDQGIAPCDRVLGLLTERLSQLDRHIADLLTERDLAAVQRQRELPTRIKQTFQALIQERVSAIVGGAGSRGRLAIPAFVVPLLRLPWALALTARFIAYGFCPPRLRLAEGQTY